MNNDSKTCAKKRWKIFISQLILRDFLPNFRSPVLVLRTFMNNSGEGLPTKNNSSVWKFIASPSQQQIWNQCLINICWNKICQRIKQNQSQSCKIFIAEIGWPNKFRYTFRYVLLLIWLIWKPSAQTRLFIQKFIRTKRIWATKM